MVSSLYTALVKLNKNHKEFTKYLLVVNDTGALLVDHGLFVLSFDTFDKFKSRTEYKELKHIGDINI